MGTAAVAKIATMLDRNVIFRRMTPPPREVTQLRLQFSVRVLGADLGKGLASFGLAGLSSELVSCSCEALGGFSYRRLAAVKRDFYRTGSATGSIALGRPREKRSFTRAGEKGRVLLVSFLSAHDPTPHRGARSFRAYPVCPPLRCLSADGRCERRTSWFSLLDRVLCEECQV